MRLNMASYVTWDTYVKLLSSRLFFLLLYRSPSGSFSSFRIWPSQPPYHAISKIRSLIKRKGSLTFGKKISNRVFTILFPPRTKQQIAYWLLRSIFNQRARISPRPINDRTLMISNKISNYVLIRIATHFCLRRAFKFRRENQEYQWYHFCLLN